MKVKAMETAGQWLLIMIIFLYFQKVTYRDVHDLSAHLKTWPSTNKQVWFFTFRCDNACKRLREKEHNVEIAKRDFNGILYVQ